ncbi:alpha-L-arabinofuranosidase C-terminal domain-containing protein [Bacteroides zhangwenhongii]|uniref:alpha-L-arabinofuranosidase C-terminal domain-containing protein n=2 Tax=Bacteroides TaxID=816 RepID=UPI001180168E|nr:alpha-L-arabinofuranosidase C-terminal domain-containing protein [Bacteroides zhangwenhongii]
MNIHKIIGMISLLACVQTLYASTDKTQNQPDSVYIFPYPTLNDAGRRGMQFVWSSDGEKWQNIADGQVFVKCDFGPWKRMYKPYLTQSRVDGSWHCYWDLTPDGEAMAYVSSPDLMRWKPQHFFMTSEKGQYAVADCNKPIRKTVWIGGKQVDGWALKVAYEQIVAMNRYGDHRAYRQALREERTVDDKKRFAGLKPVTAHIKVERELTKPISEHLIGVFFEDLNYAADGGLYAELIQNRDFEYSSKDGNKDKNWNSTYAWGIQGDGITFTIGTDQPVHVNNPHYAILDVHAPGSAFMNAGFGGIVAKKGEKYDFSMFSKVLGGGKGGKTLVQLVTKEGKEIARTVMKLSSKDWKKQSITLTATEDADSTILVLSPQTVGCYALDMISLFPQKTFKGHKNGLRADLAQAIADIHPRFVRFPGGCLAHGDGVDNIYNWKETIGPLEARKPAPNIWRYHQTRGLGYFEYFQFCEDINAEPLPVVAAGVPCQNSGINGPSHHSTNIITANGQQGGIPMKEMGQYIQDVLDLIEYANGDAKKTVWGKERAKAGHPAPFNLKYLGVGNEDMISDVFKERFTMIYNAVKEKYPDIIVIGTTGPFSEGTDYEEGWAFADELGIPMVDEHNYNTPGWFIHNQNYYDHYDRDKSKVYLGEYAAHLPGRPSNIETALAAALFLTSVERNGDVVAMTSYAPLLAKEGCIQWNPDLIYFNNKEVKPTVDYYVQQMYGQNAGNEYISAEVLLDNNQISVKKRIGTSVVRDGKTGDLIVKLVNMLPVCVNAHLEIPSLKGINAIVTKTLLMGNPVDVDVVPVSETIGISDKFPYELPAYSFTVLRIQASK